MSNMISKYNKRMSQRKKTNQVMKKMFNLKQAKVREMREENYQKMVGEWKKDKGFDMDTLGHTQKKRMVSPTSKSSVRPFKPKPLTEEQIFDRELAKIIEELESE